MNIGQSCTFTKRTFKVGPSSTVITIPRGFGIEPGDVVEVTICLVSRGNIKKGDGD